MIRAAAFAAVALAVCTGPARAADWILAPSTFTHDPQTGERVTQYAPVEPVFVETRPDYLKSGYRHNRSSIYSGDGADHHHVVEQWGRPVRPYGEWLYPYRPYSVPYHLWGPPYAGLGPRYYFAPRGNDRRRPHLHDRLDADRLGDPADAFPLDGGARMPPEAERDWRHRDRGEASGPTGYGRSGST